MADENYIETYVDGEKEGIYLKGKDAIMLDAAEIPLAENIDLPETENRELVAILRELFQSGGEEGGDEEWQPPADWPEVPEPGDYEIYILIQVYTDTYGYGKRFAYRFGQETDGQIGYGHVHCDWGDGTESDFDPLTNHTIEHSYKEDGQYLIHITADEKTTLCIGGFISYAHWLIFKSGAKMTFFCDAYDENNSYYIMASFGCHYALKHIKINHPKGVPLDRKNGFFENAYNLRKLEMNPIKPENIAGSAFNGCFALKKFPIDFDSILTVKNNAFSRCYNLNKLHMENCLNIGGSAFSNNYGLKTVVLPNCTSISIYAFNSCSDLESVYAPNCTSVGESAFQFCYNLKSVTFADGCTFGKNCFQGCYSLYPRPDGSTN